jgi:tetratricopeptide (TPR) repeat protein
MTMTGTQASEDPAPGTKAHAEAPASAGDFATALARWDALRLAGDHPEAQVYCARYRALVGDLAGAEALARELLDAGTVPSLLQIAARKLFVRGLGAAWVRILDRLRATRFWQTPERQAGLEKLCAGEFLLDLPPTERGITVALLTQWEGPAPAAGNPVNAIALMGIAAPREVARRFAELLRPAPAIYEEAARRLLRRHAEARLGLDALIAFTAAYATQPDLPELVGARLAAPGNGAQMLRFMLAHPQHGWPPARLRAAVTAALAAAEPWIPAAMIEEAMAAHPSASLPAAAMEELAAQSGNVPLALARCLVNTATPASPEAALRLAERLAALGFRRLAAQILSPFVEASEPVAFRHAQLLARGMAESRTPAAFQRAATAHPSLRIRRGLAAALAEEADYPAALALFEEAIDPQEGSLAWRDLAITLERVGAHARWGALIDDLEARFPGDDWIAAERLKHEVETGSGRARTAPDADFVEQLAQRSLNARRATMRYLSLHGRYHEAVRSWQAIAQHSQDTNDHFQYVLALCQAGDFEAAGRLVTELLQKFPGEYRYRLKCAQLMERQGDYAGALEHFARALDTEPGNPDSLAGIARCLTYLGRHERCDAWLDTFPPHDIRASWVLAARAFNAARQGRRTAAGEALRGLHSLVAAELARIEAALAAVPGAIWLHGRLLQGRSDRAAQVGAHFAADLAWLRQGTPVIIGNSPKVLGSGLGPRIDSFDRVIRLNDFQTLGHEADVGARTDLWFSSANRLAKPNIAQLTGTRVWLYQPNPQHFPDLASFVRGRLNLALPQATTTFLPPHLHQISGNLVYPRPSTGFRMITLLECVLQKPYQIAGFGFFQDSSIHYFSDDEGRLQVGEVHAIAFERDFVEEVLSLSPFLRKLGE